MLCLYYQTPCSKVLLEKITGSLASQKFPAFYGTRGFITAFKNARHQSLSWPRSIHSTPPHPSSERSIFMVSSHLRLGLPSDLFPSGLPIKPCIHLSCLPYVPHALSISLFLFWPTEKYLMMSTAHKVPRYVLLYFSVTLFLLGPTDLLSTLFSVTLFLLGPIDLLSTLFSNTLILFMHVNTLRTVRVI